MKLLTLVVVFIFINILFARTNEACLWTNSKKGVTLMLVESCKQKHRQYVEKKLNQIIRKIERKDPNLKILVLVNSEPLSIPKKQYSNFISIGFDTLRQIDDSFISDYNFRRDGMSEKVFPKFSEPLDINATYSNNINEVGIKIIYNLDFRLGKPKWSEIKKLVKYANENSDLIKANQKRESVRYNANGWYVSLLTLDTTDINNIIHKKKVLKQKKLPRHQNS